MRAWTLRATGSAGGRARRAGGARSGEAPGGRGRGRATAVAGDDRSTVAISFRPASRRAGSRRGGAARHSLAATATFMERDMQAIVTWECGGVGATCVACAIIPRGGGARAHATRVRSHAGTGDGVAARSECRHAIGRGKSRARRAFLNRRFWVHAARGGRTASSGARRSRRFFGINQSVFLVWKKCISRSTRDLCGCQFPRTTRVPRIPSRQKSSARECASVDSSPSRLLPSRPLRASPPPTRDPRRLGAPPRARPAERLGTGARVEFPRVEGPARVAFAFSSKKADWPVAGSAPRRSNKPRERGFGGKTRRSETSPISRARDGLPEPRARASADAVRAPRRAGLGRGPGDAAAALAHAPRPPLARQPARGARAGARREPPRPIRRGRRQHDPNDPANDDDDDEFARGCC